MTHFRESADFCGWHGGVTKLAILHATIVLNTVVIYKPLCAGSLAEEASWSRRGVLLMVLEHVKVGDVMLEKLLGVKEAADMLCVHPSTVRKWTRQGLLKSYRVGPRGDRRFDPEDVKGFLNRNGYG